jgi:hypothetical protein
MQSPVVACAWSHVYLYCTQPPQAEVTKLVCAQYKGAGSPHPIRVGGPDLWYQMALVNTTVKQSLVSSILGEWATALIPCLANKPLLIV